MFLNVAPEFCNFLKLKLTCEIKNNLEKKKQTVAVSI